MLHPIFAIQTKEDEVGYLQPHLKRTALGAY